MRVRNVGVGKMASKARPRARAVRAASMGLVFFLAIKTLRESPLSLVLLLVAIATGVAFQIPNVANLAGYRAELLNQQIAAGLGHLRIRPERGERFADAAPVMTVAREMPGMTDVQPLLILPGTVQNRGKLLVVQVSGVNPDARHTPYEIVSGAALSSADDNGIVIGTALANRLDVDVGDSVDLQLVLATRPRLVLDDSGVGVYTMNVRGLVGFAGAERVFIDYRFMADELGEDDPASVVVGYLDDDTVKTARAVALHMEAAIPGVTAKSWFDDSLLIRSTVGAIDAVGTIARLMSLFAVVVPVLALLYIDALHRTRQVALLTATGFNSADVFAVYLCKAGLVGVLGVLAGLAVGWGLLLYFQAYPIYDYDRFVVRPVFSLRLFLAPAFQVFLATLIAGSYPAWRAARVEPSSMLRRLE